MGVLRAAVGVALLAAPKAIGGNDDPTSALLMRTIGVRDLVLGVGAATASGAAAVHWGKAVLASDSIDVIVGAAALANVWALRSRLPVRGEQSWLAPSLPSGMA
jgi:hypothetical protein